METANLTVASAWSGVAPCLATAITDPRQLETISAAFAYGAPAVDAAVAGFDLRGQPEQLVSDLRALSATSGAVRRPGDADCHDAFCAARALFGEAQGPRVMHIALAYGYNAVDRYEPATQPWVMAELDEVAVAFGDLPASLFPLDEQSLRTLLHQHTQGAVADSERHFSVAARAGEGVSGILIDQGWHHVAAAERRVIIVHEVAHEFTRTRGRSINWADMWAEAMRADAALAPPGGFSFASGYAQTNAEEDFAESFAAYRYMAQTLKRRAPHRYILLREWAFDGLEYNAASRCAPAASRSMTIQARTLNDLATAGLSATDRLEIARGCRSRPRQSTRLLHCAEDGVFVEAFKRAWNATPSAHPAASRSALNALMRNDAFIDRALMSASAPVRARIRQLAQSVVDVSAG